MPDHLAAALQDRYAIQHEVGRGGMAVVYVAHDRRHDRQVALKVMLPELAQAIGTERFIREIRLAAQLSHPHILPVHDSGDVDGILYYVMPYVPGRSLRDRLRQERQLPIKDATGLIREAAEALDYAHEQGIIHRDVKPENILLSRGHALIADFGIAKALSEADRSTLTSSGISIGTPLYMSPEQGAGDPHLDGRSDQYSLACVLYETLVGEPPFSGPTASAVLARHALETPPHIRTVRPQVPEHIERAVQTALAKAPVDRFASLRAFADALEAPSQASTPVPDIGPPPPTPKSVLHVAGMEDVAAFDPKYQALMHAVPRAAAPAAASHPRSSPVLRYGGAIAVLAVLAVVGVYTSHRSTAPAEAPLASPTYTPDAPVAQPAPSTPPALPTRGDSATTCGVQPGYNPNGMCYDRSPQFLGDLVLSLPPDVTGVPPSAWTTIPPGVSLDPADDGSRAVTVPVWVKVGDAGEAVEVVPITEELAAGVGALVPKARVHVRSGRYLPAAKGGLPVIGWVRVVLYFRER